MQYLVSVIDDGQALTAHRTNSADPAEEAAIDVFNERLQEQGYWVFAGGLDAPDTATVVEGRGAEPVLTDGPFVETKEYAAGFWIIDVPDLDVALRLAAEGSRACNRRLEVRPFLQP